MMERTRLEEALDLQHRSYELLKWLAEAIPRGFISFDTAHEYTSSAESARAWIDEHFENLPPRARPPERTPLVMTRFAHVFASYLESSFDLLEEPGIKIQSNCGCFCPFCRFAVAAPHLQAKRVGRPDKVRAQRLEKQCLVKLMLAANLSVPDSVLDTPLDERTIREHAAMVAWATQVQERCDGVYTDESALALWRTFAWKPSGSPLSP